MAKFPERRTDFGMRSVTEVGTPATFATTVREEGKFSL
jgi:hypothetical protein